MKEIWSMDNRVKVILPRVGLAVITVLGIVGLLLNKAQEPEKLLVNQELSIDCSHEMAYLLGNVSYICSDPVAIRAFQTLVKEVESLVINNTEKMDLIKSQQSILESLVEKKTRSLKPEKYIFAFSALAKDDPSQIDQLIDEALINIDMETISAAALYREKGALWFAYNTEKSLKAYQRSTELDDNNRAGWNLLGHLYERKGNLSLAENAYTTLLDLADSNPEYQAIAYMNLGGVYQLQGQLDRASISYEKALAVGVNIGNKEGETNAYVSLGLVHEIQRDLNMAVTFYKKALAINVKMDNTKKVASIYSKLGLVYQTRGQFDQAVICYEKALALNKKIGDKEGEANVYASLWGVQETLEWMNAPAPAQVSTLE